MTRCRVAVLLAAAWAAGTVWALIATLPYVQPDQDYDGLNNLAQFPFALPWIFLYRPGGADYIRLTWVLAGLGLLNSVLILVVGFWRGRVDRPKSFWNPEGRATGRRR